MATAKRVWVNYCVAAAAGALVGVVSCGNSAEDESGGGARAGMTPSGGNGVGGSSSGGSRSGGPSGGLGASGASAGSATGGRATGGQATGGRATGGSRSGEGGANDGGGNDGGGNDDGGNDDGGAGTAQGGTTSGRGGLAGQAGSTAGGMAGSAGVGGQSGFAGQGGASSGPPIVLVLLDSSSSMFEPRASIWDPVHTALTDSTTGVVTAFQDRVRFGFSLYRGSATTHLETDPACATVLSVPFAINNRAEIETLYADASDDYSLGTLWETPTGHAIRRAADDLALLALDPPGRKYILLVTDGNPNTCQVLDPQCGQDQSIAATQYARTFGITLLAAGIGDLVQRGATGCPASARCGTNHLQDLANAGTGRAVEPPSDNYKYEQCNPNQMLSATYATPPGTATYYSGTNESEYRTAFTAALNSILSGTLP